MAMNQIYSIVNAAVKMGLGSEAIAVVDTGSFISAGNKVVSSDTNLDAVYGAFSELIMDTVFAIRARERKNRNLKRDVQTFGGFMRKVHYKANSASKSSDWDMEHPDNPYEMTPTGEYIQKIFGDRGTWTYKGQYRRRQLASAFRSEAEIEGFISGWITRMLNDVKAAEDACDALCIATLIGAVILQGTEYQVRYILDEYNTMTSSNLAATEASLMNLDFQKFFSMNLAIDIGRLGNETVLYNADGIPKHTPKDRLVVEVLDKEAKAADFYLQADTYHNEIVQLPGYNEVSYWQAPGNANFAFNDCSSIKIQNANIAVEGNATGEVEMTGIIAVLRDYDAAATLFEFQRDADFYDNWNDAYNVKKVFDKGYGVDTAEQVVIYTIAHKSNPSQAPEVGE